MNEQIIPVSGNQKIAFQCQRCSACCRHVENKVMLEPYDVYQLALHFQSEGQSLKPEDICAQYAPHAAGTVFSDFSAERRGRRSTLHFPKRESLQRLCTSAARLPTVPIHSGCRAAR